MKGNDFTVETVTIDLDTMELVLNVCKSWYDNDTGRMLADFRSVLDRKTKQ